MARRLEPQACSKNWGGDRFRVFWLKAGQSSRDFYWMPAWLTRSRFFVAPMIIGGRDGRWRLAATVQKKSQTPVNSRTFPSNVAGATLKSLAIRQSQRGSSPTVREGAIQATETALRGKAIREITGVGNGFSGCEFVSFRTVPAVAGR